MKLTEMKSVQSCWVFLYPQSITSLRHEWTHPAFAENLIENNTKEYFEAKVYLTAFAEDNNLHFDDMIQKLSDGKVVHTGDNEVNYNAEEFRKHLSAYIGHLAPYPTFSCAC